MAAAHSTNYAARVTTASGIDFLQLHNETERDGVTGLVAGAIVHADGRVLVLRRSAEDDFMAGIEELPSGAHGSSLSRSTCTTCALRSVPLRRPPRSLPEVLPSS